MVKVTCLKCSRVFDSEIEYRIHYSHNHPGPVALARMDPHRVIDVVEEPKAEDEAPYSLAASKEGLGELSPVLKDAFGNVIDGFHRLGENADWHTITVPTIDNPIKLELARLAVNYNRRKVSPEELTQRISFLIKSGLKAEEIVKQTGIGLRTVQRHISQELKDPVKVAARSIIVASRETAKSCDDVCHQNSGEGLPHTVKSPDAILASGGSLSVRTFADAAKEVAKVAESSFSPMTLQSTPELEELIPDGTPICPICEASMDLTEYREIKRKAAFKYGKQIQTLLFPVEA